MKVEEWQKLLPDNGSTFWLTRFVILRLLGFVYAVAFLVAANQILPLIGSHGLLPLRLFLERVRTALGSTAAGFFRLPSLFWFAHSDTTLVVAAWIGFALSGVVLAGLPRFNVRNAAPAFHPASSRGVSGTFDGDFFPRQLLRLHNHAERQQGH